MAVVDLLNVRGDTGDVVDETLGDMGRRANLSVDGAERAPEVVERPLLDTGLRIQLSLTF